MNLPEGGFSCIVLRHTVWRTYSTSRGLYFHYVSAAVHSLPMEKDAGFAVIPHLILTRQKNNHEQLFVVIIEEISLT